MRIEPKPRGEGVEFTNSLVGQNVDRTFVPSVEKGVMAACSEGVLAGYHIVDVKVDFYDGKQHPVDSKDVAFQIAGKAAFKECFLAARPCLLEPIYEIEVIVPESYTGDIMGDLSSRRGKIGGMDRIGKNQSIKALLPFSELSSYMQTLRSITQGRGYYTRKFSHYEDVPSDQANKLLEALKKQEELEKA
jgi:elongation factor G